MDPLLSVPLDPRYEYQGALVRALVADTELRDLLFSVRPPIAPEDSRVYESNVELPEGAIREVLPRIIVEVATVDFEVEQDNYEAPIDEALVFLHVLVDAEQKLLGEAISARVRVVLGSTRVNDSRIIAAGLVPVAVRTPVRESAFRNAWRFTREYRTPLVGALL